MKNYVNNKKKINYVVIVSNFALAGNHLNSLYLSDLPLVKGNIKGLDFYWLLGDFKMNVLIMIVIKIPSPICLVSFKALRYFYGVSLE